VTIAEGAAEAEVKIRTPRLDWMPLLVVGGIALASVALDLATGYPRSIPRLVFGCVFIAEMLWIRTFGIDLTRESAVVRGLRRRSIPWPDVQAVLLHDQRGAGRVSLVLEGGERVTLRAPTTFLGLGGARYERDFHRIGQWWLAHRGESWHPVRPEAPRLPA
jgi:hypothetical protein